MSDTSQSVPPSSQDEAAPVQVERGRSTIEFPYYHLEDAVEVATAVHLIGGTSCEWGQIAAKLNQAPSGGSFRLRLTAARTFGVIDYKGEDVRLTELGRRVIDPQQSRGAKIEAFARVPLFAQVYDHLKDMQLPPVAAMNRLIGQLGVAPKQIDKARQMFMRSARFAGYFELAADKLVKPNASAPGSSATGSGPAPDVKTGGGKTPPPPPPGFDLHPFIEGLLKTLPEPETEWTTVRRVKWLQAASNIFDLIFIKPEDDVRAIEIKLSEDLL